MSTPLSHQIKDGQRYQLAYINDLIVPITSQQLCILYNTAHSLIVLRSSDGLLDLYMIGFIAEYLRIILV